MDGYIKKPNGEGIELIMTSSEQEEFINTHLYDYNTETYLLDDGNYISGGEYVVAGINDKFFKDEESYGRWLVEYMGNNMFKLPHVRKERI